MATGAGARDITLLLRRSSTRAGKEGRRHRNPWAPKMVEIPERAAATETRHDAGAKLCGSATYAFDVVVPGMLHAKLLRSSARARARP